MPAAPDHSMPPGVPPARSVVDAVLSHLPADKLKRPPLRQLREDVRNRRTDILARLATMSLRGFYREFVTELEKQGYRPISYNTLRSWLQPLP